MDEFATRRILAEQERDAAILDANTEYEAVLKRIDDDEKKAEKMELVEQVREAKRVFYGEEGR